MKSNQSFIAALQDEREQLQSRCAAIDGVIDMYEQEGGASAVEKPVKPRKKADKKVSGRKCGSCGKPGHIYRHCPEGKGTKSGAAAAPKDDDEDEQQDDGRFHGSIEELRERVAEIRAQHKGITSLKVASMLKVSLTALNKVWEHQPGEEDDEI